MDFMSMKLLFVVVVVVSSMKCSVHAVGCHSGYHKCTNASQIGISDLCCLDDCCESTDVCSSQNYINPSCRCTAQPTWTTSDLVRLDLEYVNVLGNAVLFGDINVKCSIEHNSGYLSVIPSNICDFKNLTRVVFQNNVIYDIDNNHLYCLSNLDTLDLRGNRISYISNGTFVNLTSLRVLDLSHNDITVLEPDTFSHKSLTALTMDLSYNSMSSVDISNVYINRPFCHLDYTQNQISELVNENGFQLDQGPGDIGEGGFINFNNNNFTTFIDFEKIGIDYKMLWKARDFGIDLRGSKLKCDCKMEPFLELAADILKVMWRDCFNVTCASPLSLKGQSVPQLVSDRRFDLFVCELATENRCPFDCHCFEQPSLNRLVVNCSGRGLDSMPLSMPQGRPLQIDLSHNDIPTLSYREYLNRTTHIDVSNNLLTRIESQALKTMETMISEINIVDNDNLRELPDTIQRYNPCNFVFGTLKINCDCENLWFGSWIRNFAHESCSYNTYGCVTNRETISAHEVTSEFLECVIDQSIFMTIAIVCLCIALLIILISAIVKYYFYELYIIYREMKSPRKKWDVLEKKYDAYIACNDSDSELFKWMKNTLLVKLKKAGYRICLPYHDFDVGTPFHDEVIKYMSQSRNVILIMSEYPNKSLWTAEWKQAWQCYKGYKIHNIIFINYALVNVKTIMLNYNVTHVRPLKAFYRLKLFLDFANMRNSFFDDVITLLGPIDNTPRHRASMLNTRVKFNFKTFRSSRRVDDINKASMMNANVNCEGSRLRNPCAYMETTM